MSTTSISIIEIDNKIKNQAEMFAKKQGTTLRQAVNQFVKNIILTKGRIIKSTEVEELEPTPYLKRILRKASKDSSHDSPTFNNAKDALAYLHDQTK